jgi:Tfp pilus assembly protein PilX
MTCRPHLRRNDAGVALLTALILLLAVLIVGVSAGRAALDAERSARHERDRHIALHAAEAALADAERDIEGGADPASARAALFGPGGEIGFVAGCGRGAGSVNLGLCARTDPPAAPVWQALDLAGDARIGVGYGTFTAATMPTGSGVLPAHAPRYIIELMPLGPAAAGSFYRITAIGFGTRDATQVVLQSFYRKAPAVAPPPGTPPLPEKRISWREVANWPELHQAAIE